MMKRNFDRALEKMNELEKKVDKLNDKSADAYQAGKVKKSEWYDKEAHDIAKEIDGMASCLKLLGLGVWREASADTNYIGVWHIPLDDIERVC